MWDLLGEWGGWEEGQLYLKGILLHYKTILLIEFTLIHLECMHFCMGFLWSYRYHLPASQRIMSSLLCHYLVGGDDVISGCGKETSNPWCHECNPPGWASIKTRCLIFLCFHFLFYQRLVLIILICVRYLIQSKNCYDQWQIQESQNRNIYLSLHT